MTAQTRWQDGQTRIEIAVPADTITVRMEGELIGRTELPDGFADSVEIDTIDWGTGVFAPFAGALVEKSVQVGR